MPLRASVITRRVTEPGFYVDESFRLKRNSVREHVNQGPAYFLKIATEGRVSRRLSPLARSG